MNEEKYAEDMKPAIETVAIGKKLHDEGKYEECIEYYETALEMGYFEPEFCDFLGEYYHSKWDFEKERDVYKLIVKNIRKSPEKDFLRPFKDRLDNVESLLNNGEWLYDCLPMEDFHHTDVAEKLDKALKLLKTDKRDKGIDLLEELIEKGTFKNRVYYELHLAYYQDGKYDDSLRICDKGIEDIGFFSSHYLSGWITLRNRVIKKMESNNRV